MVQELTRISPGKVYVFVNPETALFHPDTGDTVAHGSKSCHLTRRNSSKGVKLALLNYIFLIYK